MTAKEIESEIMKLIVEVAELRAENKILKSVNDSLLQALHKPVIVRGAVTSHCLSLNNECEFTNTCPECTKPATEPLPAEGSAKTVRVDECDHNVIEGNAAYFCSKCGKIM